MGNLQSLAGKKAASDPAVRYLAAGSLASGGLLKFLHRSVPSNVCLFFRHSISSDPTTTYGHDFICVSL